MNTTDGVVLRVADSLRAKFLRTMFYTLNLILAAQPVHAQWESMFPDSGLMGPFLVNGRTIHVANGPAGLWRSSDDGGSWARVEGAINDEVVTCLFDNGTEIFCGTYAGLHVSYDTGRTWMRTDSGRDLRFIGSMASIDSHIVVSQNSHSRPPHLYRSTDAGRRWDTVRFDIRQGNYVYDLVRLDSLFLAVYRGNIILSRDIGLTWTDTGIRCERICASGSLLVGMSWPSLRFSTDAGKTWEGRSSGLPPDFSIGGFDVTGDTIVALGELTIPIDNYLRAVFLSTNAGRNWTFVPGGYRKDGGCIESLIGFHGGCLYMLCRQKIWRRSIHELVTAVEEPVPPLVTSLRMATHPNPSDGRFTLSWSGLGYHSWRSIQVLDLLGRSVWRREYPSMPVGDGSLEVDARGILVPGAYFLVLTAGTEHAASLLWIRR